MKKLSLVGAFVKKATSRNEQTFPPARVRALRLESLESRELLSVAPGSDLLVAETASICGDLTAEDVLDISGAALDGAKVQSGAAVSSASLIVVTSDVDVVDANDGVVTLREALANAESGATIAFADSLKGKTLGIDPNNGELSTDKTLTIDATNLWNAAEQTPGFTISGGGTSRILYLEEGAEVEIKGIAFADAHSDAGAIFNNKATLSLDNCAIRDNKASGVFSYDGKTTLIDCVIKNNIADASNGAAIYGKGATLSLSNCSICDNEAARGGGIYSENGKTTPANCTVANNTASLGGGVYLTGTAVLTAYNAIILNSGGSDVFRNGSNVKAYAYNTLSNYAAWTEGENNLTYDFWKPLFTNAEEGDYTLAKNSYALNKGNDEYVTTSDDLAGNARIVGRAVDLGAYEYQKSVNQETPSTVVTTTNDVFNEYDGAISLREAFEYAESGATITFADSLKGKTLGIDPNNGELSTDKTLTIDATNLWNSTEQTPGITISGGGTSRILYLEEGADVEIKGITFADAHSDAGAIYNDRATLSLDACAIRDNEAGGVYSSAGKTTLTNCTISNNSASLGGGVFLTGTAVLNAYNAIILSNGNSEVFRNGSNAKAYAYNTLSNYTAWTEGENYLTYDASKPLFTNAEEGDYTLAKNSYALNKGNDEYVTTSVDLAGNPRITGETVDLGAYEYQLEKLVAPANPREIAKTETTISVAWDAVSNASGYRLLWKNQADPEYAVVTLDATTETLVVSLAGLDDATIKNLAISVKDEIAATKLALLVDSSRVLDLAGNALRGSAVSTGADALDLVLLSEIVAETDASSAPALYDWNGDGALDLVVGEKSADGLGRVKVYLNQGATDALAYTDSFYASYWDASASCSVEIAVSGEIAPRIADITGDGLDDLLVGLPDGTIALYRGVELDGERVFSAPETVLVGASGKKKTLDVGSEAVVEVFDWNGDGRNDLVVGAADGKVRVYVDASKVAGKYDFQTAATLAVGTKDLVVESGYSAPTIADVDGDGVFDLVSGNASGALLVYRNAGTNASPKFEAATPLLDATDEPVTLGDATNSRPFAYDVNGDGVPDYLVGGSDGSVGYYEGVRLVPPNSDGTPGVPFSCSISFPFALSDPNAPVYATPTISRFGVADSGDLVVLWSTADPAEKYAVEYRLRGAEDWTGVGYFTPLFAALPGANYGVGNVVQARVKAVASDAKGESAWSKVVQYEIVGERSSYTVATDVHEVGDVCAVSVVVESDVDAIGRWTIDWNDGSEPTTFVGLSMSRTLSHIYATSGVFAPILYLDDREGVALDSITVQLSSAATLDAAPVPFFSEPPTTDARLDDVFSQFAPEPFVGPIMPDRALLSRREPTATARKATKALDRAFADMTLDSDALEFELEDDFFGDEILANFFEETL